jgi:hypothetical protein
MESNYNFILTELLQNLEDNELIEGFIAELAAKKIALQVEYLSAEWFTTSGCENIKDLLDQTLEANHQKLKSVKNQNFEAAAAFREKERNLCLELEKQGFNLVLLENNGFALYRVNVEKKPRNIKFTIYTNSSDCMALTEKIQLRHFV